MIKSFLKFLLLAVMPLFFVGDEGGGSTVDDGGSADNSGDGGQQSAAATPPQGQSQTATQDTNIVSIPKEVFEKLTSTVGEMASERAISKAEAEIVSRNPGFKLNEVHAHLKEIYKTDPNRAESLNNPAGWEMVYKAEIAPAKVEADAVNHGRKAADNPERDGIISKIKSGDGSLSDRAKLYEQYL